MTVQQDAAQAILDAFYAGEGAPRFVDIDPGFVGSLAASLDEDAYVPGDGFADDGDHDDFGSTQTWECIPTDEPRERGR